MKRRVGKEPTTRSRTLSPIHRPRDLREEKSLITVRQLEQRTGTRTQPEMPKPANARPPTQRMTRRARLSEMTIELITR